MAKVKDVFGARPSIKVNPLSVDRIDPNMLWVHYDPEADSLVIYINGAPVRAVSVHQGDDTYLKVNPANGDIVGFHIEAWVRKFIPAHPEIQSLWNRMKPGLDLESASSDLLRMLALWIIFVFKSDHPAISTPEFLPV